MGKPAKPATKALNLKVPSGAAGAAPEATETCEPEARPVQWAADLVNALKGTGTGSRALDVIRGAMVKRHNDPAHAKLNPNHPDRHLTAREAFVHLVHELPHDTTTHEKARQLIETGTWKEPPPPKMAADLLPAPPEADAPERELPQIEDPETEMLAGLKESTSGVHQIVSDEATVGLTAADGK